MPSIPAKLERELCLLRDRTILLFDLPESRLKRRYRRGGWTAREVLVHIADTEAVLMERLRRVAAQPKALIMAFDPDAWAGTLDYSTRDLAIAQSLFAAARASNIELISRHRDEAGRSGVHSEAGTITLADVAERVRWHNDHHLEQVLRATGA
ncbi:MAG: DinB family protein [Planctomycetes bacterium]|nr:DinB family protein [Planctomycetota bacterium]